MDNLTHTLVGAALAEAGLKRRTALASATLMIGANFPDIDVAGLVSPNSIDIRRGVTHGFPALVVLPFVLAWLVRLYDRRVRLRRDPGATPADFRQLVLLSAVSIWTHPTLDFMNTYGMRWLMPIVNRWFYADGLFILDIWLFSGLLMAVLLSRRLRSERPARLMLGATAVYIIGMLGVTELGRRAVAQVHRSSHVLVAPTAVVPWHRDLLVQEDGVYRTGRYSAFGSVRLDGPPIVIGDTLDPAIAAARQAPEAAGFMNWTRFPFYRVDRGGGETRVRIADARYVGESGRGWASVEVRLP